jgi:hypothetical protein
MTTNQIFAQLTPIAGEDTVLYSCQGNVMVNIRSANLGSGDSIRIALVPQGQYLSDKCYLAYDTPLVANYLFLLQSIYFAHGDNVVVHTSTGSSSFTLTGQNLD